MSTTDATTNLVAALDDRRVRVHRTDHGPVLPQITGRGGWADPPQILQAADDPGGTIMAPATQVGADPQVMLHVVAISVGSGSGDWLDLDDLGRLDHPPAVTEAIVRSEAEFHGTAPRPASRPEWFTPDWRGAADRWVDDALSAAGLHRRGPSEVIKFWSLSAILRIPICGDETQAAVFFKAACPLFRAEPAITQIIGSVAPGSVPRLLGVDTERAWMLMRDFGADEHQPGSGVATLAAAELARLQLDMVDRISELSAAGVPDRRLGPTIDALDLMLRESVELDQLSEPERRAAQAMRPWLVGQLTALDAAGMPSTLGHGDLHLGNIAVVDGAVMLYDWTDAAVTFPALDAALLARSAGTSERAAVLAAYAQVWREGYPAADLDQALRAAPLANRVYQAISYESIYRAQEEPTRWEMGGVVSRTLRSLAEQWRAAGHDNR